MKIHSKIIENKTENYRKSIENYWKFIRKVSNIKSKIIRNYRKLSRINRNLSKIHSKIIENSSNIIENSFENRSQIIENSFQSRLYRSLVCTRCYVSYFMIFKETRKREKKVHWHCQTRLFTFTSTSWPNASWLGHIFVLFQRFSILPTETSPKGMSAQTPLYLPPPWHIWGSGIKSRFQFYKILLFKMLKS